MEYLFIHGLGQTATSWNETISRMELGEQAVCPELFSMLDGEHADYQNLYRTFSDYCDSLPAGLNLCGLSIGAVLALNYTVKHPENVASLVLIAPQFRVPGLLLRVQDVIFRFMPRKAFEEMRISKEAFRTLSLSMQDLDFSDKLKVLSCPVLILCGEKDRANRKAAEELACGIKRARLRFVENAGHEVNIQAPEKLAKLLMDFYG